MRRPRRPARARRRLSWPPSSAAWQGPPTAWPPPAGKAAVTLSRRGWLALSVAGLALAASLTSLGNGFAYDDNLAILINPRVHTLASPWDAFAQSYWPVDRGGGLYRPVTVLLFAGQWALGQGSPVPLPPGQRPALRRAQRPGLLVRPGPAPRGGRLAGGSPVRRAPGPRGSGGQCRGPGRTDHGAGRGPGGGALPALAAGGAGSAAARAARWVGWGCSTWRPA